MWTLLMLALCSSLQEGMRPSQCQSLCSENEKFVNNVNPCNTCENNGVCPFASDGGPGCDCLPGFYRNKEEKCVPKEECEGGPPPIENGALSRSRPADQTQCRKDEVFLECGCVRTCCNGGRAEECAASCKQGCFCKPGLVRHEDGRCVRLKDCKKEKGENSPGAGSPPVQCSIPKCDDGCSIDYSTKPCPSCSCRDIPSIQCDMPKCDDGCSIDYSTKPCPSCSCPDFPGIQCDIPKCDEGCNIDYSTKPCPSCSCQDSPPVQCSIPNCDAGCNIDYSSKPCPSCSCPALSSPTKCKPDEQYYECIPLCHGTCSAYLTKSYLFCKMACRSGCFCREGLYKTEDGRCVPASQCTVQNTPENTCGVNEEYKECGTACPPTCADRGKKNKKCTKQCVPGCFCKKGFVKNDQGVCVRPRECQQGNPPVQCSPPKCAPGCSIDYSSKPCPSCSCTGNPPVQCSPPKCAPGCSIDYSSKPCPSCSCTGNPPVQCSPPKCAPGCSIDYSSKPCPSCSCTDTCGANAEFRECGSACPPTCANRGKKNKICTMQCVSGCFCKKGFVKNNRGVCVKPQECEQNQLNFGKPILNSVAKTANPVDLCTEDEEYQECGSACPVTCENIGKDLPCTLQCVPGCFCKKGLVRNDQRDCVEPEECPKKTCGANEEYKECGSACPPTCADRGKKNKACTKQCVSGCFCKKGFVKNDQGVCVRPQECQQGNSEECGEDEKYYDCAPSCGGTCDTYNKTAVILCLPCGPGCWCKEGLVKNNEGKCIPPEQCDVPKGNPPVQCSPPKCAPGCSIDYSSKPCPSCSCTGNPPVQCSPPKCAPGCSIDYSSKPCPSCSCTDTCGANAEYRECGSACPPTCVDRGKKNKICTMQCVSGCFCKKGFVKNNRGVCVKPQECEQNTCGENEEYRGCGSACPTTCANLGKNVMCTMQCVPGCFCAKGLVRNDQGKCVRPEECPQNSVATTGNPRDVCTEDEEYQECGSACPATCENIGKNLPCTLQCVPGCFCKKGLVRNDRGDCVEPEECPQRNCGEDETYLSCGSACPPTCSTLGRTDFACIALCVPGCFCNDGLVRNDQGECVEPEECPQGAESCPENEEYSDCASPCNTCTRRGKCEQPCSPGCDCKKGYYRDFQGKCIPKKQCPRIDPPRPRPRNQCGRRQQFYECIPRCSRTCEAYTRKPKVYCRPLCRSGCFCKEGLYETKDGKCVPPSQCPAVPPTKKCPKNEEYSDCVIPCNDCKTRGNCNFLVCNKGCDCRKGYYRDFSGRCILPRQCPQILPIPPGSTCKADEQYYECIPSCDRTCKAYREKFACDYVCISGCFCKDGLYLADDGKTCVPPEQCDKTPSSPTKKCPKNEEYSDCANPCNDCQTRGKCNFLVCNKGCDCRKGYYRDFNGRCIPARQCPLIDPTPPVSTCKENEQYYECIPSCDRTCKAYRRKEKIFCNQICISGCFCKDGLYLADDGKTCVPPEQCDKTPSSPTKKCPKNEEYSDCANPCNDCQTRGKCNFLVCNKGCDCRKGYYRDFNGRCIPARQCPLIDPTPAPTDCSPDQQYYECIPRCSRTCTAYTRSVEIFCNQLCVEGCFCKEGLYEAEDGSCVPPEQCPAPTTSSEGYSDNSIVTFRDSNKSEEELDDLIVALLEQVPPSGGTYSSVDIILQLDIDFPNEEFFENTAWLNIFAQEAEQCPENEEYSDCVNPCNDCQTRGNCNFLVCNKGCDCKKGYYRDFDGGDGRCILGLQCPMIDPTPPPNQCGADEQFYDCIPGCQQTCFALTSEFEIACKMPCRSGCYCREGLYEKDDGTCVQPEECYDDDDTPVTETLPAVTPTKTPSCGKNEEYYGCIPTCKNTCENYQAVNPICPRICIAGCSCKKGYVKRSDGKCVKPEKCNKSSPTIKPTMTPTKTPSCGKNEEYYGCIPTCKNTCENYQAVNPICPRICIAGCSCKKGFVKRSDGKCVKPEKCNKSAPTIKPTKPNQQCGPEEQYYSCIPTCKNTCDNYQAKHPICPRICRRGCFCKKGLVKRRDGKCVKPEKCKSSTPQPTAPLPTSNPTCQLEKEVGPCRASLTRYFYNYRTGQCEKFKYGGCRGNKNNFKTIDECQVICGGGSPPMQCSIPLCRVGCNIDYSTKPCPSCSCSSKPPPTNSVCMQPKDSGPCLAIFPRWFYNQQTDQCEEFTYGGCAGNKNNFEKKEDCERTCGNGSTPSPQKCDKDEEYYDCVPNCHNTCDTYNQKGPCPLYCISGCFCKKGMIKNKDGKCVKPSKCPSSNPPSSGSSDECGENEEYYDDCAPKCTGTCEAHNNPGVYHCPRCLPGCWCSQGFVKRSDGQCVQPNQCNVSNSTTPAPASNPACQQPKEVGPCRAIIPRFFFNQESRQCEQFNYGGCRGNKNNFVTKEDCESVCGSASPTPTATPTCGADEQYYQCIPNCRNTCANYNKTNIACPDICESGCFCKEGMVKNEDGKCVSPSQCNVLKPTGNSEKCGKDEKYYDCAPSCGGTCDTYNKTAVILCLPCGPGCWCKEGLVKNNEGKCIPPEQCDVPKEPPNQCGENEEYYEDCAPSCGGTCETYKKLPILNCRLCRPGCWCSKGLVKRKDGKCVPKDQCDAPTDVTPSPAVPEDSCGEDEEYQECGSACPPSCATLGRTDYACITVCVQGCFCKEGLVRNDQGDCVEPEDCPQKTCSKDEEYLECGSSCPPTCSTLGKRQICTRQCVPGCFCRKGLVRNDQGECVEPEDCPQDENPQKCGDDEEYTDCGSACPPTCSNIGKDQVCTDQCVPGCFCAEGLVRNDKGECVEPEECPQRNSEECGEDEKYYDCAPSCGGTCDTYNKTAVILCLPCGPGCWCKEGLVKNNEGKCIPPEQCDVPKGPHKLCGLNEIYYDECAPSCRGTCDTHDQDIECPECAPGCWCKKGYLKNQFGKCVLERKCNMKQKIPQCPKDQQYYDCIPSCKRTCMTYNSTSAYCPKECIMGCFCKEGLVMNKSGKCVPPEECPITCPFNQKYYECMPDCQNRCNPPDACAAVCKSGCFCREGLVMREDGKCVRKNLCKAKNPGKPRCKSDQEYYECFQRCRNSCATRNGVCPAVCESGCYCKKGLLLDNEGNCVEPDECDDVSNSAEDGSDENPESDENSEPDNKPGDKGKCSGVNEEIVSCAKPKTCNTCLIRGNCKLKRCIKGCDCKSGYYRDDSGVCIPQDQCPGATSPSQCTGENEEMVSCAKPKWCNTCGIRGNCKLKQCEAGCDCKPGYYRDDSGVCIPQDQCPGDTSSPSMVRCSMPKCDDDCNIDYSTKPCPSCSCPDSSTVQCSMPKCDDDCSIDYSTKPCPSCSCPDLPTIQCSIPKCDDDGCSIDYSTKPCPSCSCAGSPTIQCSIPKCDNDGCSIDYSSKPCPSCSCTSSPTIQCSMPKCDDEGCSIDYSTKPCPSCSCTGSPTIQCSIPKCDDDGCSVDYSTKPCPSCSCTGSPMIQCSIPKCDEDGCSIDYSTKPCPRCSCTGDSNANPANTSGADNKNDSPDGSSYSEESFSSTSENESSESGSMSQSADARKKYSRSRSGSRSRSSGNSSGNEIDSKDASKSRFSESGSMNQSADDRKKYSRSRSGSRNRSSRSSSDNEVDSEKNSSDESEEGISPMSSDAIEWSSDTSSDSENSSLRFSSGRWYSSISDGSSEENEVDSTDESAVSEDMSSSDSESGYSTMSSDSENGDQNNSLDESSVSEDTTSSDRGSGYSRSSYGSTDWSSANSEKSPSKFRSGSRTRYSKMSSDFDNDEEEQEYEEYYKEDLYQEDEAAYKGNGNDSEEYSFSWTEYN